MSVSLPKEAVKEQPKENKENLEEKPEEKLSAAFGAGAEGAAAKSLPLSQEKETEWEENDDLELEDAELIQPRPPQAPPELPALDLLPVPPMPEADLPPPKQPQSQLETKLEPKEEIKAAAKQPLPKQAEHKPIGKSAKDTKESKYKWSGKWPRPLGR